MCAGLFLFPLEDSQVPLWQLKDDLVCLTSSSSSVSRAMLRHSLEEAEVVDLLADSAAVMLAMVSTRKHGVVEPGEVVSRVCIASLLI